MTNHDKILSLNAEAFSMILCENKCLYCSYRIRTKRSIVCSISRKEWDEGFCKRGIIKWLNQNYNEDEK